MAHALDSVVGQLTVWCLYLFDVAGFEGLTQSATQCFGIRPAHIYGFVATLESEVRSGEVVLAGDVDEGPPFGVREVYACLATCCCDQVSHSLIVLKSCQHPSSWRKHSLRLLLERLADVLTYRESATRLRARGSSTKNNKLKCRQATAEGWSVLTC